jgi:hypothetical protein
MKGVVLIAPSADFGNVPGIYRALRTQVDRVLVVLRLRDKKQMWQMLPASDVVFGYKNIPRGVSQYIVISGSGFYGVHEFLLQYIKRKRVRVILTDSYYRENCVKLNKLLKPYIVYCMPELMQFYDGEYRTFYPPFERNGINVRKNGKLTIAHSPFDTHKIEMKGTELIEQAIQNIRQNIDVEYDRITGVPWQECMKRKMRAHLFVDQVIEFNDGYCGGLGKSGIEAMGLGCVTLSSGDFGIKDLIPPPPVVEITPDILYGVLLRLIQDVELRNKFGQDQSDWMRRYASYEFVGKHLLE